MISRKQKGFTLTELGIVILAIGLIIAGFWTGFSKLSETMKVSRATRDMVVLAQALEKMADSLDTNLSQSAIIGNGYYYAGDMNSVLVATGAVPQDMVDPVTKSILNPWQDSMNNLPNAVVLTVGTYVPAYGLSLPAGITGPSAGPTPPAAGSPVNTFEILFNGIPTDACIDLANNLTGNGRDPNIVNVFINDWSFGAGIAPPVSPSVARTHCNPASNNMGGPAVPGPGNLYDGSNSIDIVYKYR